MIYGYFMETGKLLNDLSAVKFVRALKSADNTLNIPNGGYLPAKAFILSYEKLSDSDKKYFEKLSLNDYMDRTEDNYISPATMEEDLHDLLCWYVNVENRRPGEVLLYVNDASDGPHIGTPVREGDTYNYNNFSEHIKKILKNIAFDGKDIDVMFYEKSAGF